MGVLIFLKRVLLILIINFIALATSVYQYPVHAAPTAQWTFEGHIYEGNIGQETRPLLAVTVSVYGASNPYPDPGIQIRSAWTNTSGWYELTVYTTDGLFDYYSIRASDLTDYTSVGAATVGGIARTIDWIEYSAPLSGKTLIGNKFWDRAPILSGRVFAGTLGDESRPLPDLTVTLYCSSNQYPDLGIQLTQTTTDATGWYGLSTYRLLGLCDYYHIIETDPLCYFSIGATSVSGDVKEMNWIEYVAPYATKTLTGNKFWDDTNTRYLPVIISH